MNIMDAVKKPALIKLWLVRALPVYIFLLFSFIGIKYGLASYLQHKYPPVIKEDKIFGVRIPFAKRVYKDKWLAAYGTWSPYFYFTALGIACIWMVVLLKSTAENANDLYMSALEKADKSEAENNLSQAIYNLKKASFFIIDPQVIEDINKKIERLKVSLASKSVMLDKTLKEEKQTVSDKTVIKPITGNTDYIANRYRKINKLGQGAMGIVWLSEDTVLERRIAIKELPVQVAEDREFKERFFREAKLLAKLTHPNIVQVYDIIEDDNVVYYTMEYVEGQSLDKSLKDKKQSMDTVFDYALQTLRGINYAHSMKIVHRDLKPMNIMVRKDGIIKIADFGLAKLMGSTSLTIAGTVMGSPMYMSPEQALGEEVDGRSDLYSFSMILYELVTGSPAFKGSTTEVIAKQIQGIPAPPSSIVNIPHWLDEFIMKGIAKDKEQRYQGASEMIAYITEHRAER